MGEGNHHCRPPPPSVRTLARPLPQQTPGQRANVCKGSGVAIGLFSRVCSEEKQAEYFGTFSWEDSTPDCPAKKDTVPEDSVSSSVTGRLSTGLAPSPWTLVWCVRTTPIGMRPERRQLVAFLVRVSGSAAVQGLLGFLCIVRVFSHSGIIFPCHAAGPRSILGDHCFPYGIQQQPVYVAG